VAVLLLVTALGEWVYRGFLRAIDQPTPELRAVADHLASSGLSGRMYPVRHGFRHSAVTAVAAYQPDGDPIPFSLVHYPSEAAAERLLQRAPYRETARRNGTIVLGFPFTSFGTHAKMDAIIKAFLTFKTSRSE